MNHDDVNPHWCDHVAVERALARQRVGRPLTLAERVEVTRRVLAAGDGATRVATILGCNGTVARQLVAEVQNNSAAVAS